MSDLESVETTTEVLRSLVHTALLAAGFPASELRPIGNRVCIMGDACDYDIVVQAIPRSGR